MENQATNEEEKIKKVEQRKETTHGYIKWFLVFAIFASVMNTTISVAGIIFGLVAIYILITDRKKIRRREKISSWILVGLWLVFLVATFAIGFMNGVANSTQK